jgi:hypothetical protein
MPVDVVLHSHRSEHLKPYTVWNEFTEKIPSAALFMNVQRNCFLQLFCVIREETLNYQCIVFLSSNSWSGSELLEYDGLPAIVMIVNIFWDMIPCNPYRPRQLLSVVVLLSWFSTLKMDVLHSSETSHIGLHGATPQKMSAWINNGASSRSKMPINSCSVSMQHTQKWKEWGGWYGTPLNWVRWSPCFLSCSEKVVFMLPEASLPHIIPLLWTVRLLARTDRNGRATGNCWGSGTNGRNNWHRTLGITGTGREE